jgi:hypothetical protein
MLTIAVSGSLVHVALLKQYFDVQAQRSAATHLSNASPALFNPTVPFLFIALRHGVGLTSL